MTGHYLIQISNYFKLPFHAELFLMLEQLLPINFIFGDQNTMETDGIIVSNDGISKGVANAFSLSLSSPREVVNKPQVIETEVKFADDPDVPFPFRGRKVSTKLVQGGTVLSMQNNEKVLATCNRGPIWSVFESGGVKHFRSALSLPYIAAEQNFNDVFNGECFLEMLVILQFIREISRRTDYQNAPLRASFIIDDPNLHWPRYGFVNYREIAALAQKENYHVAFATIPLDTWFTHASTADFFRKNSQWLSLLVHGNNHAKGELAINYPETMRKALLGQAIGRIKNLEKKAELRVCRVMVPPHGACSDEILAELPTYGFESACISAGSLRAHNEGKAWTKTLGFFSSEIIEGCPVLPRWGLTGNVQSTLLVAAYLGQPLILRGHHQDLRDGGEALNEYAKFINSLGNVFWSNMTDLSRVNYLWRAEGAICRIQPRGRKITFQLPSETTEVIIESPSPIDKSTWQVVTADGHVHKLIQGEPLLLTEAMGREISIGHNVVQQPLSHNVVFKPTPPKLLLRRLLTEARDRLLWG